MKFHRELSAWHGSEDTGLNVHGASKIATERTHPQTGNHLVTVDAVARTLGISKRHVYKLVKRKAIPVIRLGTRCPRFDLNRVLAAVKRFEVQEMTLR